MGKVANYMTSSARLRGLALSRCCKRRHQQERPRYKRVTPVQRVEVEDDADVVCALWGGWSVEVSGREVAVTMEVADRAAGRTDPVGVLFDLII